jgi:hypothetical protein
MQHTCVNPMLHEIVDCDDKELVVWVGGLERVPNIYSVSIVHVNDSVCMLWDIWMDDGTSDGKSHVIEDWWQLLGWGNGTLESHVFTWEPECHPMGTGVGVADSGQGVVGVWVLCHTPEKVDPV